MADKFRLQIGLIAIGIALGKSNSMKSGFKQGINNKLVKSIKILPKSEVVTSVDDIERVVAYSELKSYYEVDDDMLVEIDAKAVKKAVASDSDVMKVHKILPSSSINNYELNGSHYFLQLQKGPKSKSVSAEDKKLYSMIRKVLLDLDQVMLVSFTSRSLEKYAIIYGTADGLHLSQLINSNFIREPKQENVVDVSEIEMELISNKVMKDLTTDEYEPNDTHDHYSEKLDAVIRAKIEGKEIDLPTEDDAPSIAESALSMLMKL